MSKNYQVPENSQQNRNTEQNCKRMPLDIQKVFAHKEKYNN